MRYEIHQETDPIDPHKDFDHAGVMVCQHPRHNLGDTKEHPGVVSCGLPLYLYDHSGLRMSTKPFGCPWDSGLVGMIYMPAETLEKEFEGDMSRALDCLRAEVDTYDKYLSGDVWYVLIKDEDDEIVDSLSQIYGREAAEEEAKGMLQAAIDARPQQQELVYVIRAPEAETVVTGKTQRDAPKPWSKKAKRGGNKL